MFTRLALIASVALLASPAAAQSTGLTVKPGETWVFNIFRGQPSKARKVRPSTKPAPGQVVVTARTMMGTSLTISSNNPVAYTYRAELIGAGKAVPARSCALPADSKLSFEHWPEHAAAIRLSDFKPAPKGGNCP
jgi:hypothetical protein